MSIFSLYFPRFVSLHVLLFSRFRDFFWVVFFGLFKDGGPQENVVNNRGTLTKAKRNKAKQVNLTKAKRTKAKRTKAKHKVGST
jgi:hypothetical protein